MEAEQLMFDLQERGLGGKQAVPADLRKPIQVLLRKRVKTAEEAVQSLEAFSLGTFKAKVDGAGEIARLLVEGIREKIRA